jgi:dimeric dUTPase (all-alpha-NTP-PPase superfamily)
MKDFIEIYEENKKLDQLFMDKYYSDELIMTKNTLALLTEIGELANETRCFKYWSKKKPSDRDDILEEFADCMLLILMFCNYLDVSLEEEFPKPSDYEINKQFIYMYQLCSTIPDDNNKEHIKLVLSNLIKLGQLLSLNKKEIIDACEKKIKKDFMRLDDNSNY